MIRPFFYDRSTPGGKSEICGGQLRSLQPPCYNANVYEHMCNIVRHKPPGD